MTVLRRLAGTVRRVIAWWQATRPGRAIGRYQTARGGLLAGGVAYSTLFSLFAVLTIVVTLSMALLGSRPDLLDSVFGVLSKAFPGVIDTTGNGTGLTPNQLVLSVRISSVASIVSLVVLLFSALSAISAMQAAVQAMFDAPNRSGARGTIAEIATLAGMTVSVVLVGVVSLAASGAVSWLTAATDLPTAAQGFLVRAAGFVVTWLADVLGLIALFVVLAGVRVPRPDLLWGSLGGGFALAWAAALSGILIGSAASKNALLASFAVVATLLVWVNLVVRIILVTAAWTANPPQAPRTSG